MPKITYPLFALILFIASINFSNLAYAIDESRTSGLSILGKKITIGKPKIPVHLSPKLRKSYPNWSFNPKTDPQFYKYRHSQQWRSLEWDTSKWPEYMTAASVLNTMYKSAIFSRQYISKEGRFILEVGPRFYKLSDLDKRRALKLLADYFNLSKRNIVAFEVRDWRNSVKIGEYNRYGFQVE